MPRAGGVIWPAGTSETIAASRATGKASDSDGAASNHGGPLHWTAWPWRLCVAGCNTSMVCQWPSLHYEQAATSMPATRWMKAAASSRACAFAAGMARASRALASRSVLVGALSSP